MCIVNGWRGRGRKLDCVLFANPLLSYLHHHLTTHTLYLSTSLTSIIIPPTSFPYLFYPTPLPIGLVWFSSSHHYCYLFFLENQNPSRLLFLFLIESQEYQTCANNRHDNNFTLKLALPHVNMSLSSKLSITDVDLNGKRVLIRVCLLLFSRNKSHWPSPT